MAMPDVCKVPAAPSPPIPTPFPNIAMLNQAGPRPWGGDGEARNREEECGLVEVGRPQQGERSPVAAIDRGGEILSRLSYRRTSTSTLSKYTVHSDPV